jgi:hypothetical protein
LSGGVAEYGSLWGKVDRAWGRGEIVGVSKSDCAFSIYRIAIKNLQYLMTFLLKGGGAESYNVLFKAAGYFLFDI